MDSDLADAQRGQIAWLIPKQGRMGRPRANDRRTLTLRYLSGPRAPHRPETVVSPNIPILVPFLPHFFTEVVTHPVYITCVAFTGYVGLH